LEGEPHRTSGWESSVYAVVIYATTALVFTAFGILIGPPAARVEGTRPEETIPGHIAELAVFGPILGLGCTIIYGRDGLHLVLPMPTLTVLLGIDHLPAYLGLTETIRPAHSFVFIVVALALTAIMIKALDIERVMASAFMAHMAVDTGVFAPFSPITFWYTQLDPCRLPFATAAVLCAVAAGLVLRGHWGHRGWRSE
jgi:hypothetical protein